MFLPRISLLLVLVIFSSFCQQAPAATTTRQYELGTTYKYTYSAAVLLNEPPPLLPSNSTKAKGTDVGYQIAAAVEVTSVWQNPSDPSHILLEILVKNPKLSIRSRKAPSPDGFADHSSPLDGMADTAAVYLDWNNGRIVRFYSPDSESPSLVNLKKGVASLFQVQSSEMDTDEQDTSGRCRVAYKVLDARTLLKKKTNCRFQQPAESYNRPQQILGISTTSSHQTKYNLKLDSDVVETLSSTEVHSLRVNLRAQAGASVISHQFLQLQDEIQSAVKYSASSVDKAVESASEKHGIKYVPDNLQVAEESVPCDGDSCKKLGETVNTLRKRLQSSQIATTAAASAFVTLLPIVRRTPKDEIIAVLRDSKNKNILPQLMDVVAAAQTVDSHTAALDVIRFESGSNEELAERYLIVVSLSTHPSEYLVHDLLRLSRKITSGKVGETTLLSLAAVTKSFALNPKNAQNPIVKEVHNYFLTKLEACKVDECYQLYMRVFRNLGSEDMLPIVMYHIDSKDKKTSVSATKALRALPESVFQDDTVLQKLQSVYFQIGRRYDSSARTLALDILLEHGADANFLLELLKSLTDREVQNSEVDTYTLQRLEEFAGNNPAIRAKLNKILASRPFINNYHVFSQNGLSTTFSRDMYRDISSNGSFSSSTECAGGLMKRSAFDVFLRRDNEPFQLLSFGLFAGGMSSFMGSSGGDDSAAEEEATAGMEIILSGVQLRPFTFFSGTGELMSHVWAGTASERTSALHGTVLLQDHRQSVPLQSGFLALLDMRGSVSFDFGGEIQISIWNRNSHSVVDNVAAWELDGSLTLATPFIRSSLDFTVGAKAKIDFISDVSFAEDLLLCLRMGQSKVNIDYTVDKRESIPETRHWIHKRKKRRDVVEGRSYALNQKNSIMCNQMFSVES